MVSASNAAQQFCHVAIFFQRLLSTLFCIQSQIPLTRSFIGTVTLEALTRQDRANVAAENDRRIIGNHHRGVNDHNGDQGTGMAGHYRSRHIQTQGRKLEAASGSNHDCTAPDSAHNCHIDSSMLGISVNNARNLAHLV